MVNIRTLNFQTTRYKPTFFPFWTLYRAQDLRHQEKSQGFWKKWKITFWFQEQHLTLLLEHRAKSEDSSLHLVSLFLQIHLFHWDSPEYGRYQIMSPL